MIVNRWPTEYLSFLIYNKTAEALVASVPEKYHIVNAYLPVNTRAQRSFMLS